MNPIIIQIARFIQKKAPTYANLYWPIFLGWLYWYWEMGYMAVAMESPENPELLGLAMIRPVMRPEDGAIPYNNDPEGDCLFVDLFISDHPSAFPMLVETFYRRFGQRNWVAYSNYGHFKHRGRERDTRMIVKDYGALKRNASRKKLPSPPIIIGEQNGTAASSGTTSA